MWVLCRWGPGMAERRRRRMQLSDGVESGGQLWSGALIAGGRDATY